MQIIIVLAVVLVLSTIGVGIYGIKRELKGNRVKKFLGVNLSTFFVLMIVAAVALFGGGTASAAGSELAGTPNIDGFRYLAAALSTGLASIGAGIAVAVSGSAAIGAISENEKLLGKTVIFVGLAEGIAIYGLIISIMILGQ
ncbi:MAG: ATPase [Firmicutes bacterium HGW-Firmicutes-1]|jgi:V/A-type H+-transporting ATPase subunit K|nr:MAG: ATPase [Firmicutes bacterium HGW-Firmicutes-1]